MKVNEKRIFPYPVYREGSNDYKNVVFNTNIELFYDSLMATIQFQIFIWNCDVILLTFQHKYITVCLFPLLTKFYLCLYIPK